MKKMEMKNCGTRVLLDPPRDTEVLKHNPTFEITRENIDKKFKLIN